MIRFDVPGLPAPQGSKTAVVRGGRAVVLEGKGPGRQRHVDWRTAVATVARAHAPERPIDGPVAVTIDFRLPRSKSWPKRLGDPAWHTTAPDLDKLARAVLDSLTHAGLIADDARVVRLAANKVAVTGWTGATIRIEPIEALP